MMKKIFIEGMTCGHCASRVEGSLKQVCGVKTVKVDLEEGYAIAELAHPVDSDKIKAAVEDAGYEVINIE